MGWQPIVSEPRARDRYRDAIAALLAQPVLDDVDAHADRALALAYLERDGAEDALGRAIAALAAGPGNPALYNGAARIGWTLAHLAGGDEADEACRAIDSALVACLGTWRGQYDLISGLVGFGVYALERKDLGLAATIVEMLAARAVPRDGGIAWHTAPGLLPDEQRAVAPDGYWNLGLAHGMAGVVALLARCAAVGVEGSAALLERAVAYLAPKGRYAGWLPGDYSPRLAWCYGDLGVALALCSVPATREAGQALARDCAARSFEAARITDAGVCHGAAGVAHLLARMANATGDAVLADASGAWLERALVLPVEPGPMLVGATGVALVLHAAISESEPAWDRLLLADV